MIDEYCDEGSHTKMYDEESDSNCEVDGDGQDDQIFCQQEPEGDLSSLPEEAPEQRVSRALDEITLLTRMAMLMMMSKKGRMILLVERHKSC